MAKYVSRDLPVLPASKTSYFTPAQVPRLFQPIKLRGLEMQNRIMVAPMAMSSASDGHATPYHLVHIGAIASRGPGLSFIEATSVTPEGRASPYDLGLWSDSHAESLRPIVEYIHSQGQKVGIQLGHAGRKGSGVVPWLASSETASKATGGFAEDLVAPSAVPHSEKAPVPQEMSLDDIESFKRSWTTAVQRAVRLGFDAIEIHAAHGYLIHEFLSAISNHRSDGYGGSFENRSRLLLEIVELSRLNMPESMPLFVRISATEWLEQSRPELPSWNINDSIELAKLLVGKIDAIDVSSGGIHPDNKILIDSGETGPTASAYQAPLARKIKEIVGDKMLVVAVGAINSGVTAQALIDQGIDIVAVGRQFLKNPGLVFNFADELDVDVKINNQASWAFKGRGSEKKQAKA